jgi:hypothetical protein
VLERVEPEAVDAGRVEVPLAPGRDLALDVRKSTSAPIRKAKLPLSMSTWSSNWWPSRRYTELRSPGLKSSWSTPSKCGQCHSNVECFPLRPGKRKRVQARMSRVSPLGHRRSSTG